MRQRTDSTLRLPALLALLLWVCPQTVVICRAEHNHLAIEPLLHGCCEARFDEGDHHESPPRGPANHNAFQHAHCVDTPIWLLGTVEVKRHSGKPAPGPLAGRLPVPTDRETGPDMGTRSLDPVASPRPTTAPPGVVLRL